MQRLRKRLVPWRLGVWLLLLTALLLVYGGSLDYGPLRSWDDGVYALNRPEVRQWWGATWTQRLLTPEVGYPLPVPTFIYALLMAVTSDEESYIVAVRILAFALHFLNAFLAHRLLSVWIPWSVAFAAATIWALHPAVVETVVWITNLKTLCYGAALLGLMLVWQRIIADGLRPMLGVWAALLLLAGLGCRPDMVVAPAVLAFQMVHHGATPSRRTQLVAFIAATAAMSAVALSAAVLGHDAIARRSHLADLSVARRVELALDNLGTMLSHWLFPLHLHPEYYPPAQFTFLDLLPGIATAAALLMLSIVLAQRRRRTPLFLLALAGVLYLPYSQLVFIPRFAADTYLYLPGLAFSALIASLLPHGKVWDKPGPGAMLVLVLVSFVAISRSQVARWEDGVALWTPVLANAPTAGRPYRQVAFAHYEAGEVERAAAVLTAGYPAMKLHRNIPSWVPLVFEAAGQPERAAHVAAEALDFSNRTTADHYRVYLEVLARNNLSIPSSDVESDQRTRKAVSQYLQHPKWLQENDAAVALGVYFAQQGRVGIAHEFLRAAQESPTAPCEAWSFGRLIVPPVLDGKPIPQRCRHFDGLQ